jgi:P4 family phage/plasmid primase-like protien
VTDPFDSLNERANERERFEKAKPKGERLKIVTPNLSENSTVDALGTLDTDLKHAFIRKYGHLFCMDETGEEGSELYVFREETGLWSNKDVRGLINAWVSTMAQDLITNQYVVLAAQIQANAQAAAQAGVAVDAAEQERMTRLQNHLGKLIQRWGRANTIASISTMVYNHLNTDHSVRPVRLNHNPRVLSCKNGVVNLKTGEFRFHKPDDYLTKTTGTVYDENAEYKWWEEVVWKICAEDQEMYDFLCAWMGYSTTGLHHDHGLLVMVGRTRNGKSLLMDAVGTALGSYAVKLPNGFLEKKPHGSDNTEQFALAGLNGARFAFASEAAQGSDFNSSMLKAITGDGSMSARHSRKDPKTFPITHKITLGTNYKPKIDHDDDAMFGRTYLFPTPKKFGPVEDVLSGKADYVIDQTLLERASTPAGRTAIQRWLVVCAQQFMTVGLKVPREVKKQNAQHRKDMDVFGLFIQDISEYMDKGEVSVLTSMTGQGVGAERRARWESLKEEDRCQILPSVLFDMYLLWCKGEGIKNTKPRYQLKNYLESTKRVWDDEVEGQVEMDELRLEKVGGKNWMWRWIKLSMLGKQFFKEAQNSGTGNNTYNRP